MNVEELKNKLGASGLEKYFDKLRSISRNTIRLYQKPTDEGGIATGQTKIGGKPDLPKESLWPLGRTIIKDGEEDFLSLSEEKPEFVTKSLSFIAQINLSEVSVFDTEGLLPKSGILYFFYAAEQEVWGFDPLDKDEFKIIYWDGDFSQLERRSFPKDLPEYSHYKPCSVEINQEISLPSYGYKAYEEIFTNETDVDKFFEGVYTDENINKILGYSDNIQEDMELDCELVTNGFYCGEPSVYGTPSAKALEPNAKNWRLLLQIDSNDENEMMWGDLGRLYFWIKKDDLLNKRFENSWFCLQCL